MAEQRSLRREARPEQDEIAIALHHEVARLRIARSGLEPLADQHPKVLGERRIDSSIDWFWQTRHRSSLDVAPRPTSSRESDSTSSGSTACAAIVDSSRIAMMVQQRRIGSRSAGWAASRDLTARRCGSAGR